MRSSATFAALLSALTACIATPPSPPMPLPPAAEPPPPVEVPENEADRAKFCADWCASTSKPCLEQAQKDVEKTDGAPPSEEEMKNLELFCGVTRARCKRRCGDEGAGFLAANSGLPAPAACGGAKMKVRFYDVGQALAALVELPDGRRILVDTGEQPTRAGCGKPCKDWSAHLLAALAKDVPDKKLDVVWTTHQHSDHAGNADTVLKTFEVATYVDNGTRLDEKDGGKPGPIARARKAAADRGTKIVVVDPEHVASPLADVGDVKVRPVVPSKWPTNCDKDPNDCSIALRIDYCKSSVLFTGDAEAKEEALFATDAVTLLQAGHHGSDTSSSEAFAARVRPGWVVISSGKKDEGTNRDYCHPRRSTVERLEGFTASQAKRPLEVFDGICKKPKPGDWVSIDVSDRVFATARDGDILLTTTGDGQFVRE
ncbi:MAG: MBL fold metallo-hydrolase [Labilithrix sp.]|nr:MBL fold metallo-hydrolase [Labilithrix sp.]